MWNINSYDIFRFRTPGGDRFTEFVDALIKAEAYIKGVPISDISTNLRTNIGDKGVDTQVSQSMPESQTGWMSVPTCWQYKGTEYRYSDVSKPKLCEEINKEYSTELIQKDYGYRFCICDDLPPVKKAEWENILDNEITKINPNAPKSEVITASDLADWANNYPSIIVKFFQPQFVNSLAFDDWGKNITKLTSEYVEVNLWTPIKQVIIEHTNFDNNPNSVILPIQGEAGVGKTRLVYETLSTIEGAKNLVLYAIDKKAIDLAYPLAREKQAKAILVADECLPQTQAEIQNILSGVTDRVRVICIDNSGERIDTFTSQLWLERIPENDVNTILEKNFVTVPPDRRRAYVNLSRGFIRFAADLCNQDSQIATQGNINSVLSDIRTYLRNRLNDDTKLRVVEAISLFRKVGYRDDVKDELNFLCEILRLDRNEILEIAQELKDVPGYVAFAGRYLYITPEIIAQVSFEGAWKRWIKSDPSFLDRIPKTLLDAFLNRVSTSSSEEVRRIVGEFFQSWATELQPIDLSNVFKIEKFIVLIEINPEDYLALLANLVERASQDELLKVKDGYVHGSGTRRSLVWLAEKMVAFPEFFSYTESILWNLALAETELNIANNATHVWQQLFRIFLSGTAVPFSERMDLLEKRLFSHQENEINLALESLKQSFYTETSRTLGSPVVAGRIPPEDWKPKTQLELKQCFDKAFTILLKATKSNNNSLRTGAFNVAIDCIPPLLNNGYLKQVKDLFSTVDISQEILISLIRRLEDFIQFNSNASEEVKQWLQSLIPQDFHGKLIQIVGKSPWRFRDNQETWQQEINFIAQQFYEDIELLKSEMQWLTSPQAISVADIGIAIGKLDNKADYLDMIMNSVAETKVTGLARGYIVGLLNDHPQHNTIVNQWIDKFEDQMPTLAYELFRAGAKNTKAVERTLKLIEKGSLSLEYLGGFFTGLFSTEEFYESLKRIVDSIRRDPKKSIIKTALKLIDHRLEIDNRENNQSILNIVDIQSLIWELLELTAQNIDVEAFDWALILQKLAKFDLEKTVKIACFAILSRNREQKNRAEQILVDIAKSHPNLVMENLGQIILDDEYGWNFEIEKYPFLIQNIPLEEMKNWLNSVGVIGARKIAKQLALPYLDWDNDGKPVVPPLTEFVLSQFENDEETFRKFCVGSHNLQVYVGDTVAHKNKELEIARSFLNHQLRRIREWANYEIDSCQRDANYWQQIDEENKIMN